MGPDEMQKIAGLICDVLGDEASVQGALAETRSLCKKFPLYRKG